MLRVLAFEDSYDIRALLASGGVDIDGLELLQHWDTKDALSRIVEFGPEILLLDHFIAPMTGLEVLQELNGSVAREGTERPGRIIGISSSSTANTQMERFGADSAVAKFDLPHLELWRH